MNWGGYEEHDCRRLAGLYGWPGVGGDRDEFKFFPRGKDDS